MIRLSAFSDEAGKPLDEQIAALEEQVAQAQATIDEVQPKLDAANEAAFAEILPKAEEVLAKVQAGEDFDALIETYGEDGGMNSEPAKSRGYLVCDGLTLFVQEFQDAAMALENVGDVSGLVKTSFGYHILQYAGDIASGTVEFTDESGAQTAEVLRVMRQGGSVSGATTAGHWTRGVE